MSMVETSIIGIITESELGRPIPAPSCPERKTTLPNSFHATTSGRASGLSSKNSRKNRTRYCEPGWATRMRKTLLAAALFLRLAGVKPTASTHLGALCGVDAVPAGNCRRSIHAVSGREFAACGVADWGNELLKA